MRAARVPPRPLAEQGAFANFLGAGVTSESGFAGLWDFQDSSGARLSKLQALVRIRLGRIYGYGEKREPGEMKS